MKEKINKNDSLVNIIAINLILEYGVDNLTNKTFYEKLETQLSKLDKNKAYVITPEKQMEGLKLAGHIAKLPPEEIRQFIIKESPKIKKRDKER